MPSAKRIMVSTLGGILFGFVCLGFALTGPGELPQAVAFQIVISRTLIGVAIGISALKNIHWSLHGLLMGIIFSLPLAFSGLMAPESVEFSKSMMFISTIIMGMIYGLLIEVIATLLFKARIEG